MMLLPGEAWCACGKECCVGGKAWCGHSKAWWAHCVPGFVCVCVCARGGWGARDRTRMVPKQAGVGVGVGGGIPASYARSRSSRYEVDSDPWVLDISTLPRNSFFPGFAEGFAHRLQQQKTMTPMRMSRTTVTPPTSPP